MLQAAESRAQSKCLSLESEVSQQQSSAAQYEGLVNEYKAQVKTLCYYNNYIIIVQYTCSRVFHGA